MPITPDIIAELAKAHDDFAFEMKIGRILRNRGDLTVRHGGTYVDHRSGTERQFDYQCTVGSDWKALHLAVECKNVFADAPIVVCGHLRVKAESEHDVLCASRSKVIGDRGAFYLNTGCTAEVYPQKPSDLYPVLNPARGFVGKSVFIPKPPKDDKRNQDAPLFGYTAGRDAEAYDRWNQALGSAAAMALDPVGNLPNNFGYPYSLNLVLPVVVVPDSALWQIEFGADGTPVGPPQSVDATSLFRGHRIYVGGGGQNFGSIILSHVHFFTAKGLAQFLFDLGTRGGLWSYAFPEWLGQDFYSRLRG